MLWPVRSLCTSSLKPVCAWVKLVCAWVKPVCAWVKPVCAWVKLVYAWVKPVYAWVKEYNSTTLNVSRKIYSKQGVSPVTAIEIRNLRKI